LEIEREIKKEEMENGSNKENNINKAMRKSIFVEERK
jgi:hypothetical protein